MNRSSSNGWRPAAGRDFDLENFVKIPQPHTLSGSSKIHISPYRRYIKGFRTYITSASVVVSSQEAILSNLQLEVLATRYCVWRGGADVLKTFPAKKLRIFSHLFSRQKT